MIGEKVLRLSHSRRLTDSSSRFAEIFLVDFETDEFSHATPLRCDRRISDSEKWIEHYFDSGDTTQLDTPFRQLH